MGGRRHRDHHGSARCLQPAVGRLTSPASSQAGTRANPRMKLSLASSIWRSAARIYEPRGILGDHRYRVGAAVPELARKRASRGERVLHLVLGTDPLQASARTVNEANHRHTVMTSHLASGK